MSGMTPDDRAWIIEHLERKIEQLEGKLEKLDDRLSGVVTWRSLGVAVTIGVGLATLILTVSGGR